jgi:ATP-binding cassette subfamily C (CFTR/MRP) protein 1
MLSLATLVTYTIVSYLSPSHDISTGTFFTAIAVLTVITDPLLIVGQRYAQIMAATASIKRIEEFLLQPEMKDTRTPAGAIVMEDASFGTPKIVLLKNVNCSMPLKKLTMIVGPVGAVSLLFLQGRTSLIQLSSPSRERQLCLMV